MFLPNHQAIVDPQIMFTQIYRFSRVVPVVSEMYFNNFILRPFFKWMGAVPVSDLSVVNRDQNVLKSISAAIDAALQKGENVLLYPAGQIAGQGYEKIFNKQGAWAVVSNLPDGVQVIGVRISGLWGSMWSRAWIGKSPNVVMCFLKAFFYLVANLLIFLPKRKISIEFVDITEEAIHTAQLGKMPFNGYLESFYNQKGEEQVLFLKHYFYSPVLKRQLPLIIEGSVKDSQNIRSFKEEDIPEDVFQKVVGLVAKEIAQDKDKIKLETNLHLDLNVDSLGLVVLITAIEKEFKRTADVEINDIKTVADLCFVAMNRKLDNEILKSCTINQFTVPVAEIDISAEGTIPGQFLKTFSALPKETFAFDKMLGTTTRKEFLLKAMVVSRIIQKEVDGKYVGIMLPALQSSALLVAATYLAGKIPVMLNWTVGAKVMEHCIAHVQLKKVLTAKTFYDKVSDLLPTSVKEKCVFFEQKVREVTLSTKLSGLLAFLMKKVPATSPDDVAVILFTSGSESLPKAVALTHKNILGNLHASFSHIHLQTDHIFLSFLPPFHSFGFTVLIAMPLVSGAKIAYTPDPTDSREVLKILLHTRANLLLGTPTFLKMLLSVASGNDLKEVRIAISGAESLHPSVIELFKQKAGSEAQLLEGYGITECSPIITINPQAKQKQKSVGQFIPGLDHLIVDYNTYKPLPQGKDGMIMVQGVSVFNGYSDAHIDSPFVVIEGKKYYKTGDLGYMDEEGYLFITGRLKRFIKIAGEMISLPAIEHELLEKYGNHDTVVLAVEGNDQLEPPQIVLFTTIALDHAEANAFLRYSGFPNLVKIHQVIQVDEIPLLGTGKTDYKVLKNRIGKG